MTTIGNPVIYDRFGSPISRRLAHVQAQPYSKEGVGFKGVWFERGCLIWLRLITSSYVRDITYPHVFLYSLKPCSISVSYRQKQKPIAL